MTKCHKAIGLYINLLFKHVTEFIPFGTNETVMLRPPVRSSGYSFKPMVFIDGKSTEALSPAGASYSRYVGYEFFLLSHLCVVLPSAILRLPLWSFRVNTALLHLQTATRLLKSIGPSVSVHPEDKEVG